MCVCVCVCARERERERESIVCVRRLGVGIKEGKHEGRLSTSFHWNSATTQYSCEHYILKINSIIHDHTHCGFITMVTLLAPPPYPTYVSGISQSVHTFCLLIMLSSFIQHHSSQPLTSKELIPLHCFYYYSCHPLSSHHML